MDWFPLWNSLRVAAISTVIIFLLGILFAWKIAKLPKVIKATIDVILTLPLVLPPTVVGYSLLKSLSPNSVLGGFLLETFEVRIIMQWYAAIFSSVIVAFPLMYRTARGAFESFDPDLRSAGQTLGLSNIKIFWIIVMPTCKQGIIAGTVLAFARALGEYGATSMVAGYTPKQTATISTTVYQLWRIGDDALALRWVLINLAISAVFLIIINTVEKRTKQTTVQQSQVFTNAIR